MKRNTSKANAMETCIRIMENDETCNTNYFILNVNEQFNVDIFKESLNKFIEEIPIFKSRMQDSKWRYRWKVDTDFEVDNIIEFICLGNRLNTDKNTFYEDAFYRFISLKDKCIDLQNEVPVKIKILYNEKNENKVIVFCIHHCASDGAGSLQVIQRISEYYNSIVLNKTVKVKKNVRKISKLMFSINKKDFVTTIKKLLNPKPVEASKPLINITNHRKAIIDYNEVSIEKVVISKCKIDNLRKAYKGHGLSTNDIFLHMLLTIADKYNLRLEEPNNNIFIGMMVNLRRYFKNETLSIGNYFGPFSLVVKSKDVANLPKMSQKFKELRKAPIGLDYIYIIMILGWIPIFILKKIVTVFTKDVSTQAYTTITLSNIDKVDKYFTFCGDCIDNVAIIGGAGIYGFPSLYLSGYNDALTLCIIKYNDKDCLAKEIKNEFIQLMNKVELGGY